LLAGGLSIGLGEDRAQGRGHSPREARNGQHGEPRLHHAVRHYLRPT
jgi:hypothetical protein